MHPKYVLTQFTVVQEPTLRKKCKMDLSMITIKHLEKKKKKRNSESGVGASKAKRSRLITKGKLKNLLYRSL